MRPFLGTSRHSVGMRLSNWPPLLLQQLLWITGIFVRSLAAHLLFLGPGHMGYVILQWTQSSVAIPRDVHEEGPVGCPGSVRGPDYYKFVLKTWMKT